MRVFSILLSCHFTHHWSQLSLHHSFNLSLNISSIWNLFCAIFTIFFTYHFIGCFISPSSTAAVGFLNPLVTNFVATLYLNFAITLLKARRIAAKVAFVITLPNRTIFIFISLVKTTFVTILLITTFYL